jgi:hypothetical protein
MNITYGSIEFPRHVGSGPQILEKDVDIQVKISNAVAVLTGHTLAFADRFDRNFGGAIVQVSCKRNPDAKSVKVTATLGLRDWSGNWDDAYFGEVRFAVISE